MDLKLSLWIISIFYDLCSDLFFSVSYYSESLRSNFRFVIRLDIFTVKDLVSLFPKTTLLTTFLWMFIQTLLEPYPKEGFFCSIVDFKPCAEGNNLHLVTSFTIGSNAAAQTLLKLCGTTVT